MWRPESQRRWLGPLAHVELQSDGRWALADEAGVWRTARRLKVKAHARLAMLIEAPAHWGLDLRTEATIRVEQDTDAGRVATRVSLTETGIPQGRQAEVERYWSQRLARLAELASQVKARRRAIRQAVVVIHGIGEQQPGQTLANLAASGVLSGADATETPGLWVKPDYFSDSYELRRLTLEATKTRPATDVYELYWAHIIRDTSLAQIAAWMRRLLLRYPVPRPLRPWWLLVWLLIGLALAGVAGSLAGIEIPTWLTLGPATLALLGVIWRFLGAPLAIDFIGDAARYLRPHPANIAHRQTIRQAGVALIERLHEAGRYDRIVLLGHSLGSVIAYDIITQAWTRLHTKHRRPSHPSFKAVVAVERALGDPPVKRVLQDIQHAAWQRQRANTQPWLITDLVTLGSPLTYADFLMADDSAAFDQAKSDRVLPTCPPQTETDRRQHQRMSFELPYEEPVARDTRTFVVLHHAAPFAVTRWTNLYFKRRWLGLQGDPIGGPLAGLFGHWVRDLELPSPSRSFTHTWYWRKGRDRLRHLKALRGALRLESREELVDLLEQIPAFALLDEAESKRRG